MTQISQETIETLTREGLADALNEAARVMNVDGAEKYGFQGWRRVPMLTNVEKCKRHIDHTELDPDSGLEPGAHAVIRALIVTQKSLELRKK